MGVLPEPISGDTGLEQSSSLKLSREVLLTKDRLKSVIDDAFETCDLHRVMERMIEWDVSVMVHGRSVRDKARSGTRSWVIELELFPVCIIEEDDGDPLEGLRRAWQRFKIELDFLAAKA